MQQCEDRASIAQRSDHSSSLVPLAGCYNARTGPFLARVVSIEGVPIGPNERGYMLIDLTDGHTVFIVHR